jgi:hypothetical protein
MTTKYTLQDSLAYVALTGSTAGLRTSTRQTAQPYFERRGAKPKLNAAGRALAQRSRYHKAAMDLQEKGFSVDDAQPGKVVLRSPDGVIAEVDRKGRAIRKDTGEVIAHYRNG